MPEICFRWGLLRQKVLLPTSHLAPVHTQTHTKKIKHSTFQISLTFFPLSQEGLLLCNMAKAENYEKHGQDRMPWCVYDLFRGTQMFLTPLLEVSQNNCIHSLFSFTLYILHLMWQEVRVYNMGKRAELLGTICEYKTIQNNNADHLSSLRLLD